MPKLTIELPNSLSTKAQHGATANGHPTIAAYLLHLISEDLSHRSPEPPHRNSKPPAKSLRRATQSKQPVRPRTPGRKPTSARPAESIQKIRKRLLDGMMSYMKASEDPGYGYACGYQLKHIDRCASILDAFLAKLSSRPTPAQSLDIVKRTVLKLNQLNASCDHALIETDQREDLCRLISLAAQNAGLNPDPDLTEPWREW